MYCYFRDNESSCQISFIGGSYAGYGHIFFNDSKNFNGKVIFPEGSRDGLYSMENTFRNCTRFNQPITIPRAAEGFKFMFYNCVNFNSPVTFSRAYEHTGINESLYGVFTGMFALSGFNQDIFLPGDGKKVCDYEGILYMCNNYKATVTCEGNAFCGIRKDPFTQANQYSGAIIIKNNSSPNNNQLVGNPVLFGLSPKATTKGATVIYQYYDNAKLRVTEKGNTNTYYWKILKEGTLPTINYDPFGN